MDEAEIDASLVVAIEQALAQINRPLNVSVDGQSISYGSAAEAMQAALNLLELKKKQRELGEFFELRSQVG